MVTLVANLSRTDRVTWTRLPLTVVPVTQFPAPQHLQQYPIHTAAVRHKQQSKVLPMVFIGLGVIGTLLGLLVVLDRPLTQTLLAVLPFTAILLVGVWFLTYIDRWEPEPPHYIIGAFLWGAGVSAFVSGIVNTIFLVATQDRTATAMYSAPLIEESTKAAFLLVVLLATRRGRAEFNSLTDALVYGGMVGLGFAWIEHISYVLMTDDWAIATQTLAVRLILVSYLHPILTMIVAIGIWKGINSTGAMKIGWPVIGWVAAVILHFLHNGSSVLFGASGIRFVAVIELAVFIWLIVLGIRAKKREEAEIVRQLPAMVHFGWITPLEAGWLASKQARKGYITQVGKGPNAVTLRDFIQNTTELALLRGRLDATGGVNPPTEWLQLHAELTDLVSHQRPVVHSILSGGDGRGQWNSMAGQPGPQWGAPPR